MIKELIKSIGQYKKVTILTSVCMMLEVSMEIMIPFLLAKLIDEGIMQSNTSVIVRIGIELLIVAFLSLFFGVKSGRNAAVASCRIRKKLKTRYVRKSAKIFIL